MLAHRILSLSLMAVAWLIIPLQLVTTFVLGTLVSITFGLLLYPISLIWIVIFLGPLLGLSWTWEKVPLLRIPLALIGLPLAFFANIYVCLMPSMGELDSRVSKLLISESWPYSLDCWRLIAAKQIPSGSSAHDFRIILTETSRKNPPYMKFLENLGLTDALLTIPSDD